MTKNSFVQARSQALADPLTAQVILGSLAALLLLWNLSEKYLWQDEATTAVLAVRMLRFGQPLAYDGVNLITNDNFFAEDIRSIDQRTANPKAAVDYYVRRGDFKANTAWTFSPWGQFVVAAAGIRLLGQTTLAARLPFALAGIATVLLLYRFARTHFNSSLIAFLAALLLVLNAYWILHNRQCRYYALTSLFLVLTLISYARWQWGGRWGAAVFVIVAWCWFQVDYGTVWPVFGVLFVDALIAQRRTWWRPVGVGLVLAAAIAPFIFYYELWGRLSVQLRTWNDRFLGNLFNINQYVIPVLILLAVLALLVWRWKNLAGPERRLVAIGSAIILLLSLWVPTTAPDYYVRYLVAAMSVGSLLTAWVLVRGLGPSRPWLVGLGAAVLVLTPWLPRPLHALAPPQDWNTTGVIVRRELSILVSEVFGHRPDPNRIVAEWLKQNAAPTDEILINYEDVPLMYYLPNPIRGGVPAFRAEDDAKTPPRFVVLRRRPPFGHLPVFLREVSRYTWFPESVNAPDVIWGNNPDPAGQFDDPSTARNLILLRRNESGA
jgi:hypothetical protein